VGAEGSEGSSARNSTQIFRSLVRCVVAVLTELPRCQLRFMNQLYLKEESAGFGMCVWSVCNVSLRAYWRIGFSVSLCQLWVSICCVD